MGVPMRYAAGYSREDVRGLAPAGVAGSRLAAVKSTTSRHRVLREAQAAPRIVPCDDAGNRQQVIGNLAAGARVLHHREWPRLRRQLYPHDTRAASSCVRPAG